ncbi:MAG TPA: MlaD family protein [Planktothrix sp.]|jgi:phospholipid/cholesterol/gamma-HCH transport system substrate-binding protein
MTQQIQRSEPKETIGTARPSMTDAAIGVFVSVGLVVAILTIGYLKNFPLVNPPQRFNVLFHEIAGLTDSAAVYINGVRVGNVDAIKLQSKGKVLVTLKINTDNARVPVGSTFRILPNGLVGAKYVEAVLPDTTSGQQPTYLGPQNTVVGEDPERIELIVNDLAHQVKKIDIDRTQAGMMSTMQELSKTSDKFYTVANRGLALEDKLSVSLEHADALASDLRVTSKKVNQMLDDPDLIPEIRATAKDARETANTISNSIHELTGTMKDQPFRSDMLTALGSLNKSTNDIYNSVKTVDKITGDEKLRSDLKQMLSQSRETMSEVDDALSKPAFGQNLGGTIARLNATIGHLDLAARQINQMLGKKHPLVKMIFGRPGYINQSETPVTDKIKAVIHEKIAEPAAKKEPVTQTEAEPISGPSAPANPNVSQ